MANRADLDRQMKLMRSVLIGAALGSAFAAIVLALIALNGGGIADVHVPSDALSLLRKHPGGLPDGEPYVVGRGPGPLRQVLGSVLPLSHLLALGVTIWALTKRRKAIALAGIAWIVLMSLAGPALTLVQPTPPLAVSAPVAREIVRADLDKLSPDEREVMIDPMRYMKAQLAYLDGNRPTAAKLSAGLAPNDIGSPIEGAKRLQYLQGSLGEAGICLPAGCLSPTQRTIVERLVIAALTACVLCAIAALALLQLMTRRAHRIDRLVSGGCEVASA